MGNNENNSKIEPSFIYYEFNETNFTTEKNKLIHDLEKFRDADIQYNFLKLIPGCIIDENLQMPNLIQEKIIISKEHKLINNNLFFGEGFKKINEKFKKSPFISNNCKSCKFFKNSTCRGLFNEKFLKHKQQIEKKRGTKHYAAIEFEYYMGHIGFSSECNYNCSFCAVKDKGVTQFLEFITPELSIPEIMHFTHYIGIFGANCTALRHKCVHGEPLFHKDITQILDISKNFSLGYFMVNTNGSNLTQKVLSKLSEFKQASIYLSLNSINKKIRERTMGYESEIEPKTLLSNIQEYKNIDLSVSIVALKDNILNGNLRETILHLKDIGIKPTIWENLYINSAEIKDQLGYDINLLKEYLYNNNLQGYVNLEVDTNKELLQKLEIVIEQANKFKTKTLMISPENSFEFLKTRLINNANIILKCAQNSLGFKGTIAESIRIKDYIEIISKTTEDYDQILIPWRSFDANMNDKENVNINELVSRTNKPIYLT